MAEYGMKLAVLGSGTGSILEAMIAEGLPIGLFLTDRQCRGLEIAQAAGIPTELAEPGDFSDPRTRLFARPVYTRYVVDVLHRYKIGLAAMAGFGTVFGKPMFVPGAYPGLVLNTHPSLLPSFHGGHAVRDALAHGVKVTGCTIHIATSVVDPTIATGVLVILAQEPVRVLPGDTREMLRERIKAAERVLYPEVIRKALATLAAGESIESAFL